MNTSFSSRGIAFPILLILVALGIGIVGGGVYYWQQTGSAGTAAPEESPAGVTAATSPSPTPGEIMTTLPELVGRGQNLECDWRMPVESEENPFQTGKLWTTGNQGRSQIMANIGGQTMEMNALYRDQTAYVWLISPMATMGYQFSPAEMEEAELTAEQRQQAEQIRSQMIFDCRAWTPEASKFELPATVEFREM